MKHLDSFLNEWRGDSPFIVCHTSGSTGTPKEIRLSKKFVIRSAQRTIDFFGLDSKSRLHLCISPEYIGGKMMVVRAEICGGVLTSEEPSNRPLSQLSADDKIDLLAVVPSQMHHILDNLTQMPQIRNIICGGAPIDSSLRERIFKSGLNVWETYGMTETASHIALRRLTPTDKNFFTLDGISVGLREECLSITMPDGETFITKDIAEVFSEHSFTILGRKDNVIISGGKKFFPENIERLISPYMDGEFAVTSVPDGKWGEKIVCLTTYADDTQMLLEKLRRDLPHETLPRDIVRVESLPLTPNGKIDRLKLRSIANKLDEHKLDEHKLDELTADFC